MTFQNLSGRSAVESCTFTCFPMRSSEMKQLLEQQEQFFKTFLEQQRALTDGFLSQNRHLTKEITRLVKIIQTNQMDTEASEPTNEEVCEEQDFLPNGQPLPFIRKEKRSSLFGRNLGRAIFGDKESCELINFMMSPNKDQENARPKCDDAKKALFTKVVKKKYPKNPEAAYVTARESANQMGREFRGKYLKK